MRRIILITFFALFSLTAIAGGHKDNQSTDNKAWKFSLGLGAAYAPEFQGAEDSETQAVPYFAIRYKDVFSFDLIQGLNYDFFSNQYLTLGVGAAFDFGRDEDDADILEGIGDVDASFQPKLSAKFEHERMAIEIDFLTDAGGDGHDGSVAELNLGYTHIHNNRLILKPTIGAVYADDDYMQSYFGITPEQASDSVAGLNAYEADAGVYELNTQLTAIYILDAHWNIMGFAKYAKLQHDADDSPIAEKDKQTSFGIVASYTF